MAVTTAQFLVNALVRFDGKLCTAFLTDEVGWGLGTKNVPVLLFRVGVPSPGWRIRRGRDAKISALRVLAEIYINVFSRLRDARFCL